jgi:hypothetical protein
MTKAPFLGFVSLILRIYPESASLIAFSKRAVLVLKQDLEKEVNQRTEGIAECPITVKPIGMALIRG